MLSNILGIKFTSKSCNYLHSYQTTDNNNTCAKNYIDLLSIIFTLFGQVQVDLVTISHKVQLNNH
jgi:hypothetical protein